MTDATTYPLGKLREFVKDQTHLGESGFTLTELRRYLDPSQAERADALRRAAEAIERGDIDVLSPEELGELRRARLRDETSGMDEA